MDDSKQAWQTVGAHFASLGARLAQHAKTAAGEAPESSPDQAAVVEALNTLGRAIDQAVSGAQNAVKDPETRDELRGALDAMGEALTVTFAEVGEKVGDALKDTGSKAGDKVKDTFGRT